MSKMWMDIAGMVLNSVDTDHDVFSGGLNVAKSSYREKKRILHRITFVLFVICVVSIAVKYFLF